MIDGVILAGGQSSRMGVDKAGLIYGGLSLCDHMRDILSRAGVASIRISGRDGQPDHWALRGPVGGFCTMIQTYRDTKGWLFVPVDMPLLQPELLQRMLVEANDVDAVHYDTMHLPLLVMATPAVKAHSDQIAEKLQAGDNFSVRQFLKALSVLAIPMPKNQATLFANINTPEDWARLKGDS